jgi:hypothetical protein
VVATEVTTVRVVEEVAEQEEPSSSAKRRQGDASAR